MRITHLERLARIIGPNFNKLQSIFEEISLLDGNSTNIVEEKLIESFFTTRICASIFGHTPEERSHRAQRKMDIAVVKQTYHLWKDQKYFDISLQLIKKLNKTALTDIDTYFLRAPFRSMYINLPKGNDLYISDKNSGRHEVQAIYLLIDEFEESQNICILRNGIKVYDVIKQINILIWGEEKDLLGDNLMFSDLLFKKGKISDSLDLNIKILENPSIISELYEVFNFVVKLLLYINCSNASIKKVAGFDIEKKLKALKNPGKKRKLLQRFERESPRAHEYIDITIHQNSPHQGEKTGSNNKTKSLEYVRPHFKVQKFGKNYSDSKIIWIDPYIRGEGSEQFKSNKIYRVH